jgi:membrane protease YdiL (CAAX protease family)
MARHAEKFWVGKGHMAVLGEIRSWIPKILVFLGGLMWAALIVHGYQAQLVAPGNVNTEVVAQYYDRSLRLIEAGQRGNAFEKWLVGAHEDEQWLHESAKTIRELYREDLGEEADRILRALALRRGEKAIFPDGELDTEYRHEVERWLHAGQGKAWHFELYLAAGKDIEISDSYQQENDILLRRYVGASLFHLAIAGIGLICAGLWVFGKQKEYPRSSRVPDAWPAVFVLGLYFLSEILLQPWLWIIGTAYQIYYALGGIAELYALYDLLWRGFSTIFLTVLFLKNPVHLWRVFGLRQRVDWILVMAAMAAISALDWVIFLLAPVSELDPTDFMESAQPALPELATLLFSSVILAPVFEEIVFRGFLFQGLRKKTGAIWAAVISTVFFALVHTQYDIWGWLSVGLMGSAACYMTLRTGSLKSAIALHALGNLIITLDVYFLYQHPV